MGTQIVVVNGMEHGKVQRAALAILHSKEIVGLQPVRQRFSVPDWGLIGCIYTVLVASG